MVAKKLTGSQALTEANKTSADMGVIKASMVNTNKNAPGNPKVVNTQEPKLKICSLNKLKAIKKAVSKITKLAIVWTTALMGLSVGLAGALANDGSSEVS
jgi:hypothetical protein